MSNKRYVCVRQNGIPLFLHCKSLHLSIFGLLKKKKSEYEYFSLLMQINLCQVPFFYLYIWIELEIFLLLVDFLFLMPKPSGRAPVFKPKR